MLLYPDECGDSQDMVFGGPGNYLYHGGPRVKTREVRVLTHTNTTCRTPLAIYARCASRRPAKSSHCLAFSHSASPRTTCIRHERCLRLVQIGCALFVMDCFYLQQRSCALPDYGMHLPDFWQSSAMYLWGTAVFYTCFRIESHVGDDELTGKAGSTLPLQHQRTTPTPLTRLLKKPTQTTSQQPATTSSYKKNNPLRRQPPGGHAVHR